MSIENFSWVIPGKLAGSALPGGSTGAPDGAIAADLAWLYGQGVRCLISLQRTREGFRALCESTGLEWIHYPIPDFETPEDKDGFRVLVNLAIARMDEGKPVCVHCRAGVGRTGMMLACVVGWYFRIDGAQAVAVVRKTRTAIDTPEQQRFVARFCEGW